MQAKNQANELLYCIKDGDNSVNICVESSVAYVLLRNKTYN